MFDAISMAISLFCCAFEWFAPPFLRLVVEIQVACPSLVIHWPLCRTPFTHVTCLYIYGLFQTPGLHIGFGLMMFNINRG